MNCDKVKYLLDLYIDGEITRADAYEVMQHAQVCKACAQDVQAAKLMRKAIRNMDDNIDVPLKARAAWRNAVREEARKRKTRSVLRIVYGVAAALVLVVGATAIIGRNEPALDTGSAPATGTEPAAVTRYVQRDGMMQREALEWQSEETNSAWNRITTEQPDRAGATLEALVEEYSGSWELMEGGVYRIELPAESLEEFMSAASRLGTEVDSRSLSDDAKTAVVFIQISAES